MRRRLQLPAHAGRRGHLILKTRQLFAVSGRVAKVCRGEVADGQIILPANDVAIFEVR